MSDERREQYAAAIWGDDMTGLLTNHESVDGAMAVADEEIRARLRAEVEELARAGFVQASGFLAGGIDV